MRIPRVYSFNLREVFILGVLVFFFGVVTGQFWRIAQVEPGYIQEIGRISSRQEGFRKHMAKMELRLMKAEQKLNLNYPIFTNLGEEEDSHDGNGKRTIRGGK